MSRLFFKLEYTVQELRIPPEAVLSFDFSGSHEVKVVLRSPSPEEQTKDHSESNAFCTASSTVEPNAKVSEIFTKIATNQIINSDDDSVRTYMEYKMPDGTQITLPALSDFPGYFRSFIKDVSGELKDIAIRTISVLRWRANELGPHNPISSRGLHWSTDGNFWHRVPTEIFMRVTTLEALHASEQLRVEVYNIIKGGNDAPLHHDLFREAWMERYKNPRSALVIGMAAAELSVKHCISTLIPDAEWLATNLPTPPLIRMLIDYLPKLPARCKIDGKVKPPPNEVLEVLRKGVTIRNNLSHAGTKNTSIEEVEEILQAVHDLLWLIDFYSGSEWALSFLRPETRNGL